MIRGINGSLREGIDMSFAAVPQRAHYTGDSTAETRAIAALNGVCGDHLETTNNPLAIQMSLRSTEGALDLEAGSLVSAVPHASPHLVVMVHGLSLSELSWKRGGGPCIGEQLQAELGYTPLYLRYNTGRHISANGQQFAQLLQTLCETWPTEVKSISLVGHSMGGLVIRSACCYAQRSEAQWLQHLQKIICLGTPHHGSPLEKAGHAFETAMQKIPYLEPMLFGKLRSVGIKDLRHGSLLDEDWQGHDPDSSGADTRQVVPMVPGVQYFFAAASVGRDHSDPLGLLLGDLLVRPDSAVGTHKNALRKLNIEPQNCRVFHEKNHFDLLSDNRVQQQVLDWCSL